MPTCRSQQRCQVQSWNDVCACAVSNSATEHGGAHRADTPRSTMLSNLPGGAGAKGKLRRCCLCMYVHFSRLVMDDPIHFKCSCQHASVAAIPRHIPQAMRSSSHTSFALIWRESNKSVQLYTAQDKAVAACSMCHSNAPRLRPATFCFPSIVTTDTEIVCI